MNLIDLMLSELPFTERELSLLIKTAPVRYKVHYIEKRSGRGRREIAQPTAEVKLLQRWSITRVLNGLPIHSAASAYVKGKSIKDHAAAHAKSRYLLKLDFQNYFPSIRNVDFLKHIEKYAEISPDDAEKLSRILFRRQPGERTLRLSIGAPSSPFISNSIMFSFDERIQGYCDANEVAYTRYADDLAFSTNKPHILDRLLDFVQTTCNQIDYPILNLNREKTVFVSKKQSRQLTGITLTNDGLLSIGRLRKREIRAMTHRAALGQLSVDEINHLRGLISFVYSIEPGFIETLRRMVGEEKMNFLFPISKK